MNLYIPRVCELLNGDIEALFTETRRGLRGSASDKTASIGVGPEFQEMMDRMNTLITEQSTEKRLNRLWRLCMLSLVVDDKERVDKITNIARLISDEVTGEDLK